MPNRAPRVLRGRIDCRQHGVNALAICLSCAFDGRRVAARTMAYLLEPYIDPQHKKQASSLVDELLREPHRLGHNPPKDETEDLLS